MPLELRMVDKADFPIFVEPIFRAMGGNNHVVNAVYPNNLTEAGQHNAIGRFLMLQEKDKSIQWIKVVDTDAGNNAIIGIAQWYTIDTERPAERDIDGPPGTWASEDEKEYSQEVFRKYMLYRRETIREKNFPIMCEWTQLPCLGYFINFNFFKV